MLASTNSVYHLKDVRSQNVILAFDTPFQYRQECPVESSIAFPAWVCDCLLWEVSRICLNVCYTDRAPLWWRWYLKLCGKCCGAVEWKQAWPTSEIHPLHTKLFTRKANQNRSPSDNFLNNRLIIEFFHVCCLISFQSGYRAKGSFSQFTMSEAW